MQAAEAEIADRTPQALAWAFFGVGYLACYFLGTALPTPVLWYFPVEHRFELAVRPEGLGADFYGRVALSLAAGAVGYLVGRFFAPRLDPASRRKWIWRSLAWLACLAVFTGAMYVNKLIGRRSAPAPLPTSYVPR